MRDSTVFCRLLNLDGIYVRKVRFEGGKAIGEITLRRRRLVCPLCDYSSRYRHDRQSVQSVWRHLDFGVWQVELRATLRRLVCPEHGVRVEGVSFARHQSHFTRDFEQVVAWLATRTDQSTIAHVMRIAWRTVGRIIQRVSDDNLDKDRLDGLTEIGIDETSWRKGHRYLTLVTDHQRGAVIWGGEGKSQSSADAFYQQLGTQRAQALTAVSLDMGPAFAKSTRKHAPQAKITIDPFHVVKLGNDALDQVRRDRWNELRQLEDQTMARKFKGARWALLKNPGNHTPKQAKTLRKLKRAGGDIMRAYTLKEALRAIFDYGLHITEVAELIDRFCQRAARSRLKPFIRLSQTIQKHREGILAAIRLGINNARTEALNNKVRLITRRAYGFHSPQAALALIHLTCGPIKIQHPHQTAIR